MNAQGTSKPCCKSAFGYAAIYRFVLCLAAVAAIGAAAVLKFCLYFTPENLEKITLGQQTGYILNEQTDFVLPSGDGLYKDEIYIIDSVPNDSSTQTPDASGADDGIFPVTAKDLSSGAGAGEVLVNDSDSGAQFDLNALLNAPYPSSLAGSDITQLSADAAPLVLIIHTHATECYLEEGAEYYTEGTSFRSDDPQKNMIAVGKVMKDALNAAGIPTVQCETMHDKEDYNSSYNNSLASVKWYLEKYPSIKYVFDVHRDAVIRADGEVIKTDFEINGEKTAQVMTVVGTNAKGADHPNWTDNMNIAAKLQRSLTSACPGFVRPINLRGASFNQQYAPGSLLFEIGSCGNTLSEAKRAAALLCSEIAAIIKQ